MKKLGLVKLEGIDIEILGNSDYLTTAQLYFKAGSQGVNHHHINEEFDYVIKGEFECFLDGKIKRLYPGDYFKVNPNAVHNLHCLGNEDGIILSVWTPSRKDLIEKMK